MKNKMRKIWIPIILLSFVFMLLPVTPGFAASGNIKIDISQGEGHVGDTIVVSVVINYDEAITDVSYDLSFTNAIVNGQSNVLQESLTITDGSMSLKKDYEVQLSAAGVANFQISNYTINKTATGVNAIVTSVSCKVSDRASNNTRLSGLQLAPIDVVFDPNATEYNITVGEDVEKVLVKPVLEDPNATYTVVGTDNLQPGENRIVIRIVAADKQTTQEYVILVNKAGAVEETTLEETTADETVEEETTLEDSSVEETTLEETQVQTEPETQVTTEVGTSISESVALKSTDGGLLNFMSENKQTVFLICAFAIFVLLVVILLIMIMIVRPRRKARYANEYDEIELDDFSDDEEDEDDFDIENLDFDDLDIDEEEKPKKQGRKEEKVDSEDDEFEFIDIDKI